MVFFRTLYKFALIAVSVGFISCCSSEVHLSSKTTMGELAAACGAAERDNRARNCDETFRELLLLIYTEGGSSDESVQGICGPDYREGIENFRKTVITWFIAHPDYRDKSYMQAMRAMILSGAFPCPKHS